MAIYELDGIAPQVAASNWVATARGDGPVALGEDASIWFGTVVRVIPHHHRRGLQYPGRQCAARRFRQAPGRGRARNGGPQKVMLHGCTIGDETLIGIGAVVLNGAKSARTAWWVQVLW